MINFWVSGHAAPQGSKSFMGFRQGKPMIKDQCKRLPEWKSAVGLAATRAMAAGNCKLMRNEPVHLILNFFLPRPKYHYKKDGTLKDTAPYRCLSMPDLTKLVRSTEDAMTKIVYDEDSRVVTQSTEKFYERPDLGPGVHVIVEPAQDLNENYSLVLRSDQHA